MDFITGLPNSKGYTTILVVMDHLSKFAHFWYFLSPTKRWSNRNFKSLFSTISSRLYILYTLVMVLIFLLGRIVL